MISLEAKMDFEAEVRAAESNPRKLEQLYLAAQQEGQNAAFRSSLLSSYETAPDNLLYAAWYYRLQQSTEDPVQPRRNVNWIAAVPLSILTGLIFWALSDVERLVVLDEIPQLLLWWSPIATMSALIFLALTAKNNYARVAALGLGLLVTTAYALLLTPALDPPWLADQYIILAAIHIPLLCWIALGVSVLGFKSSAEDRFAFLKKSIEVMIVAGLYLIFGMIFGGITVGMFAALGIELPEIWLRLIVAGGAGLLPVLAIATVYDPDKPPSQQDFDQGLSQFIATMMRLLLPLTLAVLVIYIVVIPFFFREPYENRDVLVVYNLMLFGILGLLLGATPIHGDDLSRNLQKWLRSGIIAVAILAVLISIYALSATVFRTAEGGLTLNRLMIIGWNCINIGILLWLIYRQFKDGRERWIESLQSVFSLAANAYLVWGLILLVAVPLAFLVAL
jgi:hypothetical protein